MKYYEQLVNLGCFTKRDVDRMTGNSGTTYSLLQNYKKKGYIEQVKRNLYVTISMESKQSAATRYQIATHIKPDSYISHHTAFEYYGYGNQVFNEVFAASKYKFAAFAYDDVTYHYIAPHFDAGVVEGRDGVRATDLERTVIDSINDLDRIAGLEELLRCIDLIPSLHEDILIHYLTLYDKQFLYQKAGFILENFQNTFRLSDSFYAFCEQRKSKSIRYLYRGIENEPSVYHRRWQIYVPKDLMAIISKGVSDGEL